jgi:hypothetical protein
MSNQPAPYHPQLVHSGVANACPHWCTVRHGSEAGEDDLVHVSGALVVEGTVLRLAASRDPVTGTQDGPIVLLDEEEFTLYETRALIGALTHLVDQATQPILRDAGERPEEDARGADDDVITRVRSDRTAPGRDRGIGADDLSRIRRSARARR